MQHRTIQRVLLGVAFTGGAWLALTTLDTAAQAADHHRPAVEQPGGLLDKPLPEQASDRAKQVHGQVVPDKPKPPKVEPPAPAPKPECPEPPAADQPADEPSEEPKPHHSDPAPDPIAITLPADDPAPLPDADDLPLPAPVLAPPVVTPAALPVVIAIPAEQPPAGIVAQLVTSLTAGAQPDQTADCADDPDDARHINRDALRALLGILTKQPAADASHDRPAKPCPAHPVNPHADCASPAANNSGTNNAAVNADLTGSLTAPALARLHHARPRSSIPAGRHVAVEPGPA